MLIFSCLGCWQEVHYVPSEAPAAAGNTPAVDTSRPTQNLSTKPSDDTLESEPRTPGPIAQEPPLAKSEPTPILPPAEEVETELQTDGNEVAEAKVPTAVAIEPDSSPVDPPGRMELATWQMASKWSMAVALQAKGRNVDSYGERLEQAKHGARLLGLELPELPEYEAGADRLSANLTFLIEGAGPRLASDLRDAHGANHAALAELATNTHALLLSYTPSSSQLAAVAERIHRAAEASDVPSVIWLELIELLDTRAEFGEVKAAVFDLHKRVAAYLGDTGP